MADGDVHRFRRKPLHGRHNDQAAARYTQGGPLTALSAVAALASDGVVWEVPYGGGRVLVALWDDDHGQTCSEVVLPGRWLAYSSGGNFLYASDDANWRQWYDEVPNG